MISIIVPFYNEAESLPILQKQLTLVLNKINRPYEIIFVNDGSSDNFKINQNPNVKLINHRKRFGKGNALSTGIDNSKGEIIIFIDADLQDDPKDIPLLLKKISEGYDFVNGVRQGRKDSLIIKIYSLLAKFFLKGFLNSPYTDINCGLKAFKRDVLENFIFYGNNFRFFPLAVFLQGYKVSEVSVANRPRKFGQSKFGPAKLFIGILDTLATYFIYSFSEKPIHFFGPIGGIMLGFGLIIDIYLTIERVFFDVLLYRRPLLLYGILFTIVGLQIILSGILAELIVFMHKKTRSINCK